MSQKSLLRLYLYLGFAIGVSTMVGCGSDGCSTSPATTSTTGSSATGSSYRATSESDYAASPTPKATTTPTPPASPTAAASPAAATGVVLPSDTRVGIAGGCNAAAATTCTSNLLSQSGGCN